MKKLTVILFIGLLFFALMIASAEESPQLIVGEEDKEKVDNAIENIPLDSSGNFDSGKFAPIKTKADMRIDAINKWFEDNTPWLAIIFGITPAISWLFALNILVMLFFLVIALNLPTWKIKIIGLVVFLILLILKLYVAIARGLLGWIESSWIIGTLVIIGLIVLDIFIPKIISRLFKKDEMKETLEKAKEDEEELETKTKAIRGK